MKSMRKENYFISPVGLKSYDFHIDVGRVVGYSSPG